MIQLFVNNFNNDWEILAKCFTDLSNFVWKLTISFQVVENIHHSDSNFNEVHAFHLEIYLTLKSLIKLLQFPILFWYHYFLPKTKSVKNFDKIPSLPLKLRKNIRVPIVVIHPIFFSYKRKVTSVSYIKMIYYSIISTPS